MVALLIGNACLSAAVAEAPAMSGHLYINGLPDGKLVAINVAGHSQFNDIGGQGRYDFQIAGQTGEYVQVLANDREAQGFTFDAGAHLYLNLTYADGVITGSPYNPDSLMPEPSLAPTIVPESDTERTGIGMSNSVFFIVAIILAPIVVGICAIFRLGRL